MIVSIDGPAGSGKSTVAKLVAEKIGFIHFNSGALYRGITCHVIANNLNIEKDLDKLSKLNLSTEFINGKQHVFVNGIDHTANLRDINVSELSPIISSYPEIRKIIDNCQRTFAETHNVVIEGRDIGSYVFPNAEFKFYLDCNVNERARRRLLEEQQKGSALSFEEIKQKIIERDNFDKNKPISPLVIPQNAIIVDSSNLSIEQVVNEIVSHIK